VGADFISAFVSHRNGVTPSPGKAMACIDGLKKSDLQLIHDYDDGFANSDTDTEDLNEVQTELRRVVDNIFHALGGRESSYYRLVGWTIYFAGGMSHGDDPSEAFTAFCAAYTYGELGDRVLKAAGFELPPNEHEPYLINEAETPLDLRELTK